MTAAVVAVLVATSSMPAMTMVAAMAATVVAAEGVVVAVSMAMALIALRPASRSRKNCKQVRE